VPVRRGAAAGQDVHIDDGVPAGGVRTGQPSCRLSHLAGVNPPLSFTS
jgi:hypothetical protein